MDLIIAAAVALAVAVLAAFREGIIKHINRMFEERNRVENEFVRGMETLRCLHEKMEEILHIRKVSRVLFFAGSNSGGIPKAETPFYTQAIHGCHKKSHSQIDAFKRLRTRREMDSDYVKTLLRVYSEKVVVLSTFDMADSKLKSFYISEEVHHAALFFIAIRDMRFLYLAVKTCHTDPFDQNEIGAMEMVVEDIRNSIK
jgi:hypothetical protein